MKVILDASVAISYLHPEDASPAVRRWLVRWVASGGMLVVPRHFWLEVVNSLAVAHRYPGASVLEAIHELRQLPVETVDIGEAGLLLVIDAVERHGLTAYDAQYVALAEQLEVPIVTMDRAIAGAVGERAIDPSGPPRRLSEQRDSYGRSTSVSWPDYSGAASYIASLRAELKGTPAKRGASAR